MDNKKLPAFCVVELFCCRNTSKIVSSLSCFCAELASICHEAGTVLLVDEAHGAHLGLHPALPPSAIQQGADVAVQVRLLERFCSFLVASESECSCSHHVYD